MVCLIEEIIAHIESASNFAIVMHDNPDADAIGSAIALELLLQQQQKTVDIVTQTKVNRMFEPFMPNKTGKIWIPHDKYDVVFVIDCSSEERICYDYGVFEGINIVIDHHIFSKPYGDIYWCEDVMATAVLIYKLAQHLPLATITSDIATALYLGIVGDSCNFTNYGVDADLLYMAATLVQHGADIHKVNEVDRYTKNMFDLHHEMWNKVIYDCGILCIYTTKQQMENHKTTSFDLSCLIDMYKKIKDVKIAILFVFSNNKCYLKARSDSIDVGSIMRRMGGGGHKNAAGAVCYVDSEYSFINHTVKEIKEFLRET